MIVSLVTSFDCLSFDFFVLKVLYFHSYSIIKTLIIGWIRLINYLHLSREVFNNNMNMIFIANVSYLNLIYVLTIIYFPTSPIRIRLTFKFDFLEILLH